MEHVHNIYTKNAMLKNVVYRSRVFCTVHIQEYQNILI